MSVPHRLFAALRLDPDDGRGIRAFAKSCGIEAEDLKSHDFNGTLPTGAQFDRLCAAAGMSPLALRLSAGCLDQDALDRLRAEASRVAEILEGAGGKRTQTKRPKAMKAKLKTEFGVLFQGDCLDLLHTMDDESVDLIFADPPFNLNKLYPSGVDDNLRSERYLAWCEEWLTECCRVLKRGGSLFLWNLPKWNAALAPVLSRHLMFRHWIAVDIKYSLPISGRLYPSHYSLLYYTKGDKPSTFTPDRLPMDVCPSCLADLKDYGGYKDKMNPAGVNLSDVWLDVPPVRHAKYKRRNDANELSIKLLDRIIELASSDGDLVFDPFGGSGTTYVVAELKRRRWMGIELGPVDDIIRRFKRIEEERGFMETSRAGLNRLFPPSIERERLKRGLWTVETERARKAAGRGIDGQLDLV
jgi:site-specific DNA-methyltransferase (adenine-specific)